MEPQNTQMQRWLSCGLQIIQALRSMNLIDRLDYFQFNQGGAFDE
jgi:hypothetical protein